MTLDFISILLILGMGQCIFLLGTILLGKKPIKTANIFLSVLLLSFLWYQVEFFLLRNTLDAQILFIYSTRYGSWLLLGPLIYLYTQALVEAGFKWQNKYLLHFIPFVVFTLILPLLLDGLITNRSVDYGMLTVFDAYNRETLTFRHYLYATVFLFQFLHAMLYLFVSYRSLLNQGKSTQRQVPVAERIQTLRYLYLSVLVIILLCSGFIAYIFLTTYWRRNMDYIYVLPLFILVFGLAYRAMRYPDSVWWNKEDGPKEKYQKSGLTLTAREIYRQKLMEKVEHEKIYRDNSLRLADLAAALEMPVHHLSQLINEDLNQNFFDFINSFRIKEAQEKIILGKEKTLMEVAYAVGFNSKNAFNSAFKKHVGMTPSAFKKAHQKG